MSNQNMNNRDEVFWTKGHTNYVLLKRDTNLRVVIVSILECKKYYRGGQKYLDKT